MIYKTFKHKTLPGIFAVLMGTQRRGDLEIGQSFTPELFVGTASLDIILKYYQSMNVAIDQLNDYDLVEVEVTVKP